MIIFTSICTNYTHKAKTLADSVKKYMPDAKFMVCMTEREKKKEMDYKFFDEVILSKDMWEGNFNRFIYKHTIVEASTAVKARFFQYLMQRFPRETEFIYLDPDCYVYSSFVEVRELLKRRPIILCPHLLQPGNIDMELSSTARGVFNLGFLAVNNSDEAKRFINWWAERLYLFCYDDIQRGIFTDQKWIDLAPCFFDTEILKHRGYDFAPWSLLNCDMTKEGDRYYVKGDPIRFIHFSGYGKTAEKCMNDWLPSGEHPFRELYANYSEQHEKNDVNQISKVSWSYASYYSGEKINDKLRKRYRTNYDVMSYIEDPFALGNSEIALLLKNNSSKLNFVDVEKMKYVIANEGVRGLWDRGIKKLFGQ